MSWPQVAQPHVGHRLTLRDPYSLKCVDCQQTLVIHRETGAPTPQPPPWRRPDVPPATPEAVAWARREAMAALELVRQRRTTAKPEETT
jgi:hypothetical protein